jgi:uncharacterized protein
MRCRAIYKGNAKGEAVVVKSPISFLGDIDPKTGIILNKNLENAGASIAGKILVFPKGRGSTVGSYVIYQLKKNGVAPRGIINSEAEPIVAVGAIISEIPMIDRIEKSFFESFRTGDIIEIKPNGEVLKCKK